MERKIFTEVTAPESRIFTDSITGPHFSGTASRIFLEPPSKFTSLFPVSGIAILGKGTYAV